VLRFSTVHGKRVRRCAAGQSGENKQKASTSFLKKRSKKLFFLAFATDPTRQQRRVCPEIKSFLVLFFKKVQHRPLADPLG
jgi:hypothetical protein